jgi:hypothetical protein
MTMTLKAKREQFAAKQAALAQVFAEAGTELDLGKVTSLNGTHAEKAATITQMNDELAALSGEVEQLAGLERLASQTKAWGERLSTPAPMIHPTGGAIVQQKSLGELFVQSVAYKGFAGGRSPVATLGDVDLKTLFQTSAGMAPEVLRINRVELTPQRPLLVSDLPMLTETTQSAVKFLQETTFTNEATETTEGSAYPEGELAMEEESVLVRKIAVFLPCTDEQLEDEPRARDYVNNRLARMIRERLDGQILNGDGAAPNHRGILATTGVQTQALGADTVLDAIYKAMTKVRHTGHSEPDAVVLHPNDWQAVRLTRTTDGLYIWGNPSEAGREQVWGIPVIVTSAIAEGTGLVGAFRDFSELAVRRGLEVQVSNSHDGYFTQGIQAIRADFRAAVVVYRPVAFCKVTGI